MVYLKRDLKLLISKHKSFINLEKVKYPLFCMNILGRDYAAAYKKTFSKIPKGREVAPDDISIDSFIEDVENFIFMHEEAGEDVFYPIVPFYYIPWAEAIIGCPVFAGKDSFYAKPFIDSWESFNWSINLDVNNEWFSKLIKMTDILTDKFGDIYPIGSSTHLRGPADMMAAALGQSIFPLELYDNPDKIKKFSCLCSDIFIRVAKKLNEIASKAKFSGYVVNNYGIWTENVCQYYQDDSIAFLSPKFYRKFILDSHLKIDKSFVSTLYHVHPVSMFVVNELVNFPNLRIIEINREPEAIGPTVKEMIPYFKKIQKYKKSLLINFADVDFSIDLIEEETELICRELSYRGLCIYGCAKDIDDGFKKSKAIKNIFKKIKK